MYLQVLAKYIPLDLLYAFSLSYYQQHTAQYMTPSASEVTTLLRYTNLFIIRPHRMQSKVWPIVGDVS